MITAARMGAVDRNAEALGVSQKQLMESSGNAVARAVREEASEGDTVTVVAGRGNNGGDALVAARFLDAFDLSVHLLGKPETITTEIARENWAALEAANYPCETVADSADLEVGDPEVIVDAMLGTGISGDLREPEATAAREINASDATVISVDVPSGVDADSGEVPENAVSADRVITFHDGKPGLADLDCEVRVADIGIPGAAERYVGPGDLELGSPAPDAETRVFVIGGGPYTGAPALSAQAALRSGADLSFLACPESIEDVLAGYTEDLIVQAYESERLSTEEVDGLIETATKHDDVVVLGPGLGTAEETLEAARTFLEEFEGPMVVDADALSVVPEVETEATLICTPNRKELAGMGGPELDDLEAGADDIERFAAELGHVVMAKGEADVVSDGERTRISTRGTPGMTVGGTGDTLAGITAAFMKDNDPLNAAAAAAYANGRAAERLDRGGGLLASDLLDEVPEVVWGER
ncbi:bifunctional ADP-dependent NAD(P)H-hydrate dehydratase/NAD(P)H-hydrate epimerase [Halalkalicoccus jeotgali]|uniref:Bifunctional NAD(P)H-hydrate repair enzyme n=1 Tax=Halalkalicoccus jeotgali (strain DSM 18796 / CECT 7217 / JCM 14584 / KCTC 4019 / B3) TaxID=795797 RepID=D8J3D9_HALJB|nr:bifunctional ADP-dependent NAD(P)H-hydrate dehydratase/NAD(P)H-hydrate epimerase [Halalkalicoccus jeotgali]ADJ15246.1 carbohydrate kinase, YjeF related protein [Halalkalicoccus jeotgali B3]ELY35333.1 carbohydrate kinase [Halalkalicoccus jeotgali B3]